MSRSTSLRPQAVPAVIHSWKGNMCVNLNRFKIKHTNPVRLKTVGLCVAEGGMRELALCQLAYGIIQPSAAATISGKKSAILILGCGVWVSIPRLLINDWHGALRGLFSYLPVSPGSVP